MITLELNIDNIYEDGESITNLVEVEVEEPWAPVENWEELEIWADECLQEHTGTGRTEGEASYFVEITKAPEEWQSLVGKHFEWGV